MHRYFSVGLLLCMLFPAPVSSAVSSWGYQLQNYDIDELVESEFDLLVLDYSKDGSDSEQFSPVEIRKIQDSGKILLSYISIGEAEDYRYYFDSNWLDNPPPWFDGENPDWVGNYKVKYWDSQWQTIIFGYLDRIIAQGFDGVYLDIIDAYEFYEASVPDADLRMIDFVVTIADYTRTNNPGFLIFPQNGEALLTNNTYLDVIDGIGREDVYILPDEQERRDSDEIQAIEQDLDLLVGEGKTVLVVDYTDDTDLIEFARRSAEQQGYVHYVGTLELDQLLPPDYTGQNPFPWLLVITMMIVLVIGAGIFYSIKVKK